MFRPRESGVFTQSSFFFRHVDATEQHRVRPALLGLSDLLRRHHRHRETAAYVIIIHRMTRAIHDCKYRGDDERWTRPILNDHRENSP